MTGLSRSTIYRLQAEGRFPQSIKIAFRATGWIEHEVQRWIAQRIEYSRSAQVMSMRKVNRPRRTAA
jgi:prophage regulatory protein